MRSTALVTAVSGVALMLSACTTTDPYGDTRRNNTATGALGGALAGAALGYLTNTNNSEEGRKNALIGAGVGALAGAAVGNYMDRQQAALEQELSGTGVGVIREGDNLILRMPSDVTFATNQAAVQSRFYPVMDDVARVLNQYNQSTVDILGHADSDGAEDYNLDLSRRRATSVADLLVARGVAPQRLIVDGFGESRPIASNASAEGKARNRRVEIMIRPFRG